jgi:hypothetical protein
MSDVNEELVRRYFETQGYLVRSNLLYRMEREKSAGWSDVDLCILQPITGDAAAVEIRGYHTEKITPSYLRETPEMFYFTRPEAKAAVSKLLGKSSFSEHLGSPRNRGSGTR